MFHTLLPLRNQRTGWRQRHIQNSEHCLHIFPRDLLPAGFDALHDLATNVCQRSKFDLRETRSFSVKTYQ